MKTQRILIFFLLLLTCFVYADDKYIFKINDPRGDDYGDGTVILPGESDLRPGDLDITSFAAREEDGGTMFEIEFGSIIEQPDARVIDAGGRTLAAVARLGFFEFNVDIYIDMDRKEGSGFTSALPGRKVGISSGHAWEKVIFLNPRPNDARSQLRKSLNDMAEETIRREKGRVDPEDKDKMNAQIALDFDGHYFIPTRVRVAGRRVQFFVPGYFLRGPAQANWSYIVFTTASTIEDKVDFGKDDLPLLMPRGGLLNLPIGSGAFSDRLGTTRSEVGLLPPIVDLIVPDGVKQEDVLRNYNVNEKKPVILQGVIPVP